MCWREEEVLERISINRDGKEARSCKKCVCAKCHCTKQLEWCWQWETLFQRPRKDFWHRALPPPTIVIWVTMGVRVLWCGCLAVAICELRELWKGSLAHINWPVPTGGLASTFSRSRSCRNLSTRGWNRVFLFLAEEKENCEFSPNCVVVFFPLSLVGGAPFVGKTQFSLPQTAFRPIFFLRRLRIVYDFHLKTNNVFIRPGNRAASSTVGE